jgi:hypothetical protein
MTRIYKQHPVLLQGGDLRRAAVSLAERIAPQDEKRADALARTPLMRVALMGTDALDGLALTSSRNAAYRLEQKRRA